MSRHAYRSVLAVLVVPAALVTLVALGDRAEAAGLDVELRCSVGATDGATLSRLTFDTVGKVHNCRVLLSNNTGQALTNVGFHLGFGQAPVADLVDNPLVSDYDPGAMYNCDANPPAPGSVFRPNMVLDVKTVFDGYKPGTSTSGSTWPYGERCFDHTITPSANWTVSMPASSTAALRVEFRSGFLIEGSNFTTALQLDTSNLPGGVAVAPITLPVDVAMPLLPLAVRTTYEPIQARTLTMAGTMFVGTDWYGKRGSQTGLEADFYLPYLKSNGAGGYALTLDGNYSAANGDKLLFDPADLELNTTYMEFVDLHSSRFRDFKAPGEDSSTTARKLPFEKVSETAFHIDFGYLSGNNDDLGTRRLVVSWAAAYSRDAAVQAFLAPIGSIATGRLCGSTDQAPSPVCAQTNAPLYAEETALTHIYGQLDWVSFNLLAQWESSATTAFSDLIMNLVPPYVPWRGGSLTMVMQLPTNVQGQRGIAKNIYNFKQIYSPQPYLGYVSSAATDGGHEANLPDRTVPSSVAGDWTGIGTIGFPTRTSLPGTTTEVRVECSPSRYGVRNLGSRVECDPMVTWSVPRNARSSIDGTPTYVRTDMTHASLGATARVTMRDGTGTARRDARHSFNVEVEGGSRYSVSMILDPNQPQNYLGQYWKHSVPPNVTTNQYAAAGCVFANIGLDNVYGPVQMTIDWPVGWEPTPTADPRAGLRVLWGPETLAAQGQNWGSVTGTPVPSDRFTVLELDTAARTITVEVDGPRDGNPPGSFPGADQVAAPYAFADDARWFAVRLDGWHVPGAARLPVWNCSVEIDQTLSPSGVVLEDVGYAFEPAQPFRVLGEPAPVLGGSPSPTTVASHASWTTTIDLRNAAYDANGGRLLAGAAVSARDGVVYFSVPQEGDFSEAVEHGLVDVSFADASAPDAHTVWVTSASAPPMPVSGSLAAPWVQCAGAGATCDATALAGVGLTAGEIKWVAFVLDEVLVTDAPPRGSPGGGGVARAEVPYLATVHMVDVGSDNGVVVRPRALFVNSDTLTVESVPGIFDVTIVEGCSACDDSNACTTNRCDRATQLCVYDPLPCAERGIFAPVKNRDGEVIGAIHCQLVDGALDCDTGEDTDGDGRPNLVIYAQRGNACTAPIGD